MTTFRALAGIVRTFLPRAEISFSEDKRRSYDLVHNVDAGRVRDELGIEHPPLEQRVLIHRITAAGMIHDAALDIPPIPVEAFYGTMGTSPAIEAISTP